MLGGNLARLGIAHVGTFTQEVARYVMGRQSSWLASNRLAADLHRHWPEVKLAIAGG